MASSHCRQIARRLLPRMGGGAQKAPAVVCRQGQEQSQGHGSGGYGRGGERGAPWAAAAAGVGLVGAAIAVTTPLVAEEKKKMILGKSQTDRIREFATADNVFEHFAGYQLVSETGKKTILMSTRNFYNAMTPGSDTSGGVKLGRSAYEQIHLEELNSKFLTNANKLPVNGGNLLNTINEHGMLTYTDYHFLLLLMSTPTRYLDIIFHGFDISADGSVEAKEFVHVLSRIANIRSDIELELIKAGKISGLVRYLFKDDLSGTLTREDFKKLQNDLITDVLSMEFTRYVEDIDHKMSEVDFCRHLLLSSQIPQKKKEKMIKMVAEEFKNSSEGISFESFKSFYYVLFGGADLERAMFFLDEENQGVTRDEFAKVANWVVGAEVDPHVIEVIYCLLDEDGDRNLSTTEFNPVLFNWRSSRGFQKGSLSVTLGNMKF